MLLKRECLVLRLVLVLEDESVGVVGQRIVLGWELLGRRCWSHESVKCFVCDSELASF